MPILEAHISSHVKEFLHFGVVLILALDSGCKDFMLFYYLQEFTGAKKTVIKCNKAVDK